MYFMTFLWVSVSSVKRGQIILALALFLRVLKGKERGKMMPNNCCVSETPT